MQIESASQASQYHVRRAESAAEAEPDRDADDARRGAAAQTRKAAELKPDYLGNKIDLTA